MPTNNDDPKRIFVVVSPLLKGEALQDKINEIAQYSLSVDPVTNESGIIQATVDSETKLHAIKSIPGIKDARLQRQIQAI